MLYDIDKNSEDRGSPMPNHSDRVIEGAHKSHGTVSTNYTTDATPTASGGTNTGTAAPPGTQGFKRLVNICPVTVVNDGSTLSTATVAHNLSYVPVVEAAIEGATVTTASGSAGNASLPLPIFTSASIGSITAGAVTFGTYLYTFADSTNMYVNFLNATGKSSTITVTCYLYQRVATS